MEASEQEISDVFGWLQNERYVTVDVDWLDACISWLKQRDTTTRGQLKELVYEQWLLSDLEESGSECLPHDIRTIRKTEMQGCLPLQMNSIVNVGAPAYGQLNKLQGLEQKTDEPRLQMWQPKPSRMLMLELTDGKQMIKGMEYKPIKLLNSDLLPGTKILIKGTAICRRGVLFLTEKNVEILGGQTHGLLEENSQINVLKRLVEHAKCGPTDPEKEQSPEMKTRPDEVQNSLLDNRDFMEEDRLLEEESVMVNEMSETNGEWQPEFSSNSHGSKSRSNVVITRPVNGVTSCTGNKRPVSSTLFFRRNQNERNIDVIDDDLEELINDEESFLEEFNNGNDDLAEIHLGNEQYDMQHSTFKGEMDDLTDEVLQSLVETEFLALERDGQDKDVRSGRICPPQTVSMKKPGRHSNTSFSERSSGNVSSMQSFKSSENSRQTMIHHMGKRDAFIDLTSDDDF